MSAEDRAALDYPHDEPLESGKTLEVAPGVYWLRMPLPFALNHINLWLLEDGDGWTIVDTGFATDETRGYWEEIFANTLDGRPVKRIIATHFHPDHLGLAGWLSERWEAPLWITEREWLMAQLALAGGVPNDADSWSHFYQPHGVGEEGRQGLAIRQRNFKSGVTPVPTVYRRITGDETIEIGGRKWRVIIGHGHAPEHVSLYSDEIEVMIAGDQVLPHITTNISVQLQEPEGDPLAQFLDSFDEFRPMPETTLVLPSHGLPFYGLHTRLDQLVDHHDVRLTRVETACDAPRTAQELLPVLFNRKLDAQQFVFAMGECVAHLNYLMYRDRLTRDSDGGGVYRFLAAGA